MKRVLPVVLFAFVSFTAHAITVFPFPNQELRITYSNFAGSDRLDVEEGARDLEKEKEMRELIEAALSPLKRFSATQIGKFLGPERELTDEYYLPAYYHGGLTLSNPQVNGEPIFHFFPIGDLGGLVVLQMSENPQISGGAIYFRSEKVSSENALDREAVDTILGYIKDRTPGPNEGE